MTQRYLVTGCAGFIGSVVCRLLLERGDRVTGIDNLGDTYDPRLKRWRVDQLKPHRGFDFQQLDICDPDSLATLFAGQGTAGESLKTGPPFAAVVHLAARAGVRQSVANPGDYYRTNVIGTLNLLEQCRPAGVKKFVLASSSSVYGAGGSPPFLETDDTDHPLSPYAATKKAAEVLCYTYHRLHGLDVSILRFFVAYGPAGRPDMSIFRFIRRVAEDEPIVVFGDGTQRRGFTYVDDIARGTIKAIEPCGFEIVNLGGDRPVELLDVIAGIGQVLGRTPNIEHRPAHAADAPETWADCAKARALLGWSAEVALEEGLRRTAAWYRQHRSLVLPLELGDR